MTIFFGNRTLLEAFRRGERAALTVVYHQYVDEVADLVRHGFTVKTKGGRVRGIREHDRQRDLVQEVFLRAFSEQARRAYDGVSPFRPYLLRIAKNLMIDEGRKAVPLAEPAIGAGEAPGDRVEIEIPSPEDDLEWHRLREATRAYCATLNEKLQRFVKLRFEEERSQRDAARALEISRHQVRAWERKVREGLRRHLEGMERRLRPVERGEPRYASKSRQSDVPFGQPPKEQAHP